MKKSYPHSMKMLLGAMAIFAVSGVTLFAQDEITDPTTLDLTAVSTVTFGEELMSPPLPSPTDDFSLLEFQPSFVSSSLVIQPVPEPSTIALGGLAIASIVVLRSSRQRTQRFV